MEFTNVLWYAGYCKNFKDREGRTRNDLAVRDV